MSIIPISNRETQNMDPIFWDPFQQFQLSSAIPSLLIGGGGRVSGRVEWEESPTAYVVKGYLPGVTREQVTVEVEEDGRVLKIGSDGGKFLTSFAVPEDAMVDYLDASMGNGLLVVVVPKQAVLAMEAPPRRAIEITEVSD